MIEIIPTVVPERFDDIVAAKNRYSAFARTLHVDATDGMFALNKTWLPFGGEKLPESTAIYYEAHLMIKNPLSFGVAFARAGAKRITGHIEAFANAECAREAFAMWRKAGAEEVGVAILLTTRLEEIASYMDLCDFVHVMTIDEIGKQGVSFSDRGIERVSKLKKHYPDVVISVDGGVTSENIGELLSVGAERFCIGSALSKSRNPEKEYKRLVALVDSHGAVSV